LEWAKRYNGPANASDRSYAIAVDETGYVYVTGGSQGDLTTIKYNSNGDSVWVRRWNRNPPGNELSYDIVIDDSGFVYVSGSSTIKYNPNGNLVWEALNNGAALGGFVLDDSSNIFTGCTNLSNYRTNKFNRNGVLIWTKTYNGPANDQDRIYDIGLDPWGNVIVTGGSWGIGTQWDYATIKYSPSGDEMWVRRYNGPAQDVPTDIAYALAVDDSGNVYVTGQSDGANENPNCFTIKYNPEGDTIWTRRYPILSAGYEIELDNFGNLYIAARTNGINYTVLKYTGNGDLIWERTKPGEAFADPHSIAVDSAGNVYLACSRFVSSIRSDILIVKYDTSGNQRWEASYNGGSNNDVNFPNDITIGANGNVYVAGQSIGTGTLFDYVTIKYSQVTGITQINNEVPHTYSLQQNYPNPFNPVTRIKFQLKNAGVVNLAIYDMLGRELETLVNEELKPGTYEVNFNGENLSSGIYYYKLVVNAAGPDKQGHSSPKGRQEGNYSETKKMVLLK
jgi:hypothetical protein